MTFLKELFSQRSHSAEFKNFEYLELIRSLAHLGILFLHTMYASGAIFDHQNKPYPHYVTIIGGWIMVDVLFIISALLACLEILRKLEKGQFSILEFYSNRIFRFIPTLYAGILYFMLFIRPATSYTLYDFVFMTDYVGAKNQYLGFVWSIAADVKFHLIAPLLVFLLRSLRHSPKLRFSLVFLCAIFSMALRTTSLLRNCPDNSKFENYYFFGVDSLSPKFRPIVLEKLSVQDYYYFPFHFRFMPFVYGALLANMRFEQVNGSEEKNEKESTTKNFYKQSTSFNVLLVLTAVLCYLSANFKPIEWYLADYNRAVFLHGIAYDLSLISLTILFYMLLMVQQEVVFFAKWRIWVGISKLTYCSYMFHFVAIIKVISWFKQAKMVYPLDVPHIALVFACVIAVDLVYTVTVYVLVEKPAMDWRHGRKNKVE